MLKEKDKPLNNTEVQKTLKNLQEDIEIFEANQKQNKKSRGIKYEFKAPPKNPKEALETL